MRQKSPTWILLGVLLLVASASGATDPVDVAALESFLKGVKNADALGWKSGTDPCSDGWEHLKCQGSSVTGLLLGSLGIGGTVSADLSNMKNLATIQMQGNSFTGPLPSFSGLSMLQTAYLNGNSFDTIPADFFDGLSSLTELFIDENPLNRTNGWELPDTLAKSTMLQKLSLSNTSLVGGIPEFLGKMSNLKNLNLAYNRLGGGIPASFENSNLVEFRVNNQQNPVLSGPVDVVGSMQSLSVLWLHVNRFSGPIPAGLTNSLSLEQIRLNDNQFVGTIPPGLADLPALKNLTVRNNMLVGSLPKFRDDVNFDFSGNSFCVATPGGSCSQDVSALLDFLGGVQYPSAITASWVGNNPCGTTPWLGIVCNDSSVTVLNLANNQLNGTISPSLGNMTSLTSIKLSDNMLEGLVPDSLTRLPLLTSLDLSNNKLSAPVPTFPARVRLSIAGNPLTPASPQPSPPGRSPSAPGTPDGSVTSPAGSPSGKSKVSTGGVIGGIIAALVFLGLIFGACLLLYKNRGRKFLRLQGANTVVVHPRSGDSNSDAETVKIVVANTDYNGTQLNSRANSGPSEVQVVETGNLVISIHVLRQATNNFNEATILGRGGFGVVYKGVLDDGTAIAVKRMEGGLVSNKGLSEFQAEIAVLTKVRHRHLVALLGYCIEGNEKLLVYEYMPQGTLSQHLFEYEALAYKPLTWKQRLSIALDVARGIEYLHGLAHKSFIHRDLKPSNILLGDDLKAKVSDFGLVKLAPEGKYSVETRLAGTFGYLAPEYAVTGRVTTKADVFSFGVVLMELITGRRALDETHGEENMHLVTWFRRMSVTSNKDKQLAAGKIPPVFLGAIDKAIEAPMDDETFQTSFAIVAELAGHCTAREPFQRPDMGHVVNQLSPLVEQWKPSQLEEESAGIDLDVPLRQVLKKWQEDDSFLFNINDTQSSLPPRPSGFAESFTSEDGR